MKATGIVRRVDELGRIVLPKELRDTIGIESKDPLEIFVDDDFITLKKYEEQCILCGNTKELVDFKGKKVCRNCIELMK